MSQVSEVVKARIRRAKDTVAEAQRTLDEALSQLDSPDRAEKTMISEALRDAFASLTAAREALDKVEAHDPPEKSGPLPPGR